MLGAGVGIQGRDEASERHRHVGDTLQFQLPGGDRDILDKGSGEVLERWRPTKEKQIRISIN